MNGSNKGNYTPYDPNPLSKNISDIKDFFVNKFMLKQPGMDLTIVLGDQLSFTAWYDDLEKDPELRREWKFIHDPTKINGRVIDHQMPLIAEHDQWITAPQQPLSTGTYKVRIRAQDDPIHWKDNRFFNFQKWSDEQLPREYTLNVHRRPIADFTFQIDKNNNFN